MTKNLSAGRVQSPAVKLIVDRERQRRDFHRASYWDLKAKLTASGGQFEAELKSLGGQRVANGADFDDTTGKLKSEKEKILLLGEKEAGNVAERLQVAKPWKVSRLQETEGVERPYAPFMTTTLQQDANRKYGFSADRTMRIAQSLYEGVTISGEQVGLIMSMRKVGQPHAFQCRTGQRPLAHQVGLSGTVYLTRRISTPARFATHRKRTKRSVPPTSIASPAKSRGSWPTTSSSSTTLFGSERLLAK